MNGPPRSAWLVLCDRQSHGGSHGPSHGRSISPTGPTSPRRGRGGEIPGIQAAMERRGCPLRDACRLCGKAQARRATLAIPRERFAIPAASLEAAADETGRAADALVMAVHCAAAVGLIFSAMENLRWKVSPPIS